MEENYSFYKKKMFSFIEKITDLGFYVALNLIDDKSVGIHANHAVLGIGTDGNKLLIKNSWGDEKVYEMEISETLALEEFTFGVSSCVFYIPCLMARLPIQIVNTRETMNTFSEWLDDYVRDFPEMVADIPAILASTPDPDPPPEVEQESKHMRPTFEVGDMVISSSHHTPLKLIESLKNGSEYRASYIDDGVERQMTVYEFQLTKVGGTTQNTKITQTNSLRIPNSHHLWIPVACIVSAYP